ncbi:MAG TPA: hypothetical protein PKM57_10215 [Kiritimatiellia bacterium]|nr:hypothetical protein [Kiritimatiellia bacterium]HPS07176.1 hypothetical protein [Kiritimatiellia bacterium]
MLALALSAWAGPATVVRDIAYNEAAGQDGLGDLYLPADVKPDTPVVLTIHGGWGGGFAAFAGFVESAPDLLQPRDGGRRGAVRVVEAAITKFVNEKR